MDPIRGARPAKRRSIQLLPGYRCGRFMTALNRHHVEPFARAAYTAAVKYVYRVRETSAVSLRNLGLSRTPSPALATQPGFLTDLRAINAIDATFGHGNRSSASQPWWHSCRWPAKLAPHSVAVRRLASRHGRSSSPMRRGEGASALPPPQP